MKRSTQLQRTGFKPRAGRPVHVRTPLQLVAVGGAVSARMGGSTTGVPEPKHDYIRSPKLLAAVRRLPCQYSGVVGRTEPAHSNWALHGKGRGIKADDNRVAALAREVHRELDQGARWSEEERKRIWWHAHCSTVLVLQARGEWPRGVPVPDIETYPW